MKTFLLLTILAYVQLSSALMNLDEFQESGLIKCYDTNLQDTRRISLRNVNGQVLPLPNSVETFISLMERYESLNPNDRASELAGKLLKSFRMDDLYPVIDEDEVRPRDGSASMYNEIKRVIFSVPDKNSYQFGADDFTDDEKCALHFMLSHTVNDTRVDERDVVIDDTNRVKQPREYGVVSLHNRRKHAFALGRVLLGIYAGLMPSTSEDITAILSRYKITNTEKFRNMKINLVHAVTLGDLITRLSMEDENAVKILENGEWSDISCPIEYRLDDNNGGFVTYSELRGAVDGLIIGIKIQENRQEFSNFRLSQILRQYYAFTGMIDPQRTRWCSREVNFQNVAGKEEEMLNYNRLYRAMSKEGNVGQKTQQKINNALATVRSNIFKDVERDECNINEQSTERKYTSPRNIFALLDYSSNGLMKLEFQAEVIGNLSSDFDLRPRGNLMGVYSNLKPLQQNTLDVIVKNSGIAGCPSCFAKHYAKTGNKEDEAELFRDVNDTIGTFDREQELLEEKYQSEGKAASPGKIVLYFNFGSPNVRVGDSLWDLKRYHRGVTILVVGDNREALEEFVENEQTDIFPSVPKTIYDLKQRINKVPAEFTYRACNQSTASKELANKQVAFIQPNKIQYWAMYPQYFLKSYGITMKFRPQEGTGIKVCFSRYYGSIIEGTTDNCKESTGGDIEFYTSNPCHKENIFTCRPFYFSVEGKKQPTTYCQSLRCSAPNDIQFEFEHQGISCNIASYVSISSLVLLLAAMMHYMQRQ